MGRHYWLCLLILQSVTTHLGDCEFDNVHDILFDNVRLEVLSKNDANRVVVTNAGFEEDCSPLDNTKSYPYFCYVDVDDGPIGWEIYNPRRINAAHNYHNFGIVNPSQIKEYMNGVGATEGSQSLFTAIHPQDFDRGEYGVQQTVNAFVAAQTTYILKVDICNPLRWNALQANLSGSPQARIDLLADDHILAQRNVFSLSDETWTTATIEYTAPDHTPYKHHPLTIRLVDLNHLPIAAATGIHTEARNLLRVPIQPNPRCDPTPTTTTTPYPTKRPTPNPTKRPSPNPTKRPTPNPTKRPSPNPTKRPTPNPTGKPTSGGNVPTPLPVSPNPTKRPTAVPTPKPITAAPTPRPTPKPTTLSPTQPGVLGCGESTVGTYQSGQLIFEVRMLFAGQLIFDADLSMFAIQGIDVLTKLGSIVGTDSDHDGVVTLTVPAGDYTFFVVGETSGIYHVEIRCVSEEPTPLPTQPPTKDPTNRPTYAPADHPVTHPSVSPITKATDSPSKPTEIHTKSPTKDDGSSTAIPTQSPIEISTMQTDSESKERGGRGRQEAMDIGSVLTDTIAPLIILCCLCVCGCVLCVGCGVKRMLKQHKEDSPEIVNIQMD
eukprot:701030_1